MKKKIISILVVIALTLGVTTAQAAQSTTVNVNVGVPTISGGLNLMVYKIEGDGDGSWTDKQTLMNYTLQENRDYNIFESAGKTRYAIDVGVRDNSGTNWTLTHTRSSIKKHATNNLDDHINVTFVKQTDSATGTVDKYVSFADSNNVSYTKSDLDNKWLRVYYGIGMDDPDKPDATGVTPVPLSQAAGTYNGSVTFTLTP